MDMFATAIEPGNNEPPFGIDPAIVSDGQVDFSAGIIASFDAPDDDGDGHNAVLTAGPLVSSCVRDYFRRLSKAKPPSNSTASVAGSGTVGGSRGGVSETVSPQ